MNSIFSYIKQLFVNRDSILALLIFSLCSVGLIALYSASIDVPDRVISQVRNILLTFALMWLLASLPSQWLLRFAVPLYTVGITLLIAVALFGLTRKGAKRWINIGIIIQPSELMKIAMPLMLAWYYQLREGSISWVDHIIAFILVIIPVALVAKQPDLGTALLVAAAGLFVIYFAGLSFKIIAPLFIVATVFIAALLIFETDICQANVSWPLLHDYQKHRICTLLNPSSDPLGKGFHTIQAVIAIGSGGLLGKGWLSGTQTHLEFIPEKHTDFIFAVIAEEFGFLGILILFLIYFFIIMRGLWIASNALTLFSRLLAGGITMTFFTYAFVNIGMVSGILPVVGVPLPMISYGGTALVTLGIGAGILLSIARQKKQIHQTNVSQLSS